jgi:hypothetical protein
MRRKLSLIAVAALLMVASAFAGAGLWTTLGGNASAQVRERPSAGMMDGGMKAGGMMDPKMMMNAMREDPEMRRHMSKMERSMDDMTELMRKHMAAPQRP